MWFTIFFCRSDITLNSTDLKREIDPYFCALSQALFTTLFYGSGYVIILLFFPKKITSKERTYPHSQIVATGVAQAMGSTFMNLCLSGTRTAPYLVALLGNFLVPIQFTTRWETGYKTSDHFSFSSHAWKLTYAFGLFIYLTQLL